VIGNFSFQKLAMVKDLENRTAELMSSDIVAAIAGDTTARRLMSAANVDVDPKSLDSIPPANEFAVMEAGSSQQCAIFGIVAGQSAEVYGPPGTGKSPTITNLIATLAATGKKVLFVAEKRAALEVVMNRLSSVGLDHLAIDLRSARFSWTLESSRACGNVTQKAYRVAGFSTRMTLRTVASGAHVASKLRRRPSSTRSGGETLLGLRPEPVSGCGQSEPHRIR
jgi:reverse gyrase